ncbi:MAG TPA: ATP-dependent DNA ligase [Bryobacteraceae bacterium]|nr:ATP-dependent DNA ligase [Bryobacteraceae bacterium]
MLLADLVDTSRRVAETSRRLQKTELLADLLRRTPPEEIEAAVCFLSGTTRQGRTGIGYASLRSAAGSPAETASLQLSEVDRAIETIASTSGTGSTTRRREALTLLFGRSTEAEQRFLFGLLTGEIRQGALEGVMVEAIGRAAAVPPARVRRAVMMAGQIAEVARVALTEGDAAMDRYDVQLFRPVQPMLAGTAEDVTLALDELGEASLEYKFDGARIQVHKSGDGVKVYSRALNDVTAAVPEVVEGVRALPARELILDGEVMSFDPTGRPNPFQVTMRRFGRKLDVDGMRAALPLQPVWFDLLFADGGSLLDAGQQARFSELQRIVPVELVTPHLRTADREQADEFVARALAAGHEGGMANSVAAPYAAGSRGQSWLKVKQAR